MEKQQDYIQRLEVLELLKIKQFRIKQELKGACDYKSSLLEKITMADKQIEEKQRAFYSSLIDMQLELAKLKIFLDLEYVENGYKIS